jgi:hypothetical protein
MKLSLHHWLASTLVASLTVLLSTQPGSSQVFRDPVLKLAQTTASANNTVTLPQGSQITLVDAAGDRIGYEILQTQVERISPAQSLLKLTVRMTNGKPFPVNFWNESFRLRLGTDTLAPSNFLNEVVDGNSTKTGEIVFTVPNGALSGSLIFLTSGVEDQLPIALSSTNSQPTSSPAVVPAPAPVLSAVFPQGSRLVLVDAAGDRVGYEILQTQVERISPAQSLLKLTVRMTNGKPFPVNFWNESFRLSWGGNTLAPSNFLNEVVQGNSTQSGEITFTIPNATGSGSLGINLGGVQDQLPLQVR